MNKRFILKFAALVLLILGSYSLSPLVYSVNSPPPAVPAPSTTLDYSGWVQCDGVVTPGESKRQVVCNFANLVSMVKYLINWAFGISIPVMVGLLAYAGFLYMTGSKGNIDKAKKIMISAVKGFVWALMAWFIVTTLLKWILTPEFLSVTGTLVGQ
jgi:hypothetical protein